MLRNAAFDQQTQEKLRRFSPDYVIGSLLFCVTAARFPAFASHSSRLRSLRSAAYLDEAARSRWADAGFFLADEAAGAACCFHCGCRLPVRPTRQEATPGPLRLHDQLGDRCELLTLLKVAHGMLSERHERVASSSAKLRRALAKLRSDLHERRSMLGVAESFGFARSCVLFSACRHFMTRGGQLPDRPGDLIELIHELDELRPDWSDVISVEASLEETGASSDQQRQTGEQQRQTGEQERQTGEQQRQTGDQQRQTGEQQRQTGEQHRQTGEQQRQTGDQQRQTGEQHRQTGEQHRQTGEQQRQTGEQHRQTEEQQGQTTRLQQQRPETETPQAAHTSAQAARAHTSKAEVSKKCSPAVLQSEISVEEEGDTVPSAAAESEKCLQCGERTRDRVTLPCAHFLLCSSCVSSRADCPKCGLRILASIKVFIT